PNLNLGGLAWLAVALFVCLVAVAIRRPSDQQETIGKTTPAVDQVESLMLDWAGDAGEAQGTRFWVRRTAAAVCHLAVLAALVFIGWRHFQAAEAGMAAATFYLLLPYTAHFFEQLP